MKKQIKKAVYISCALAIFLFSAAEKSFACSCVSSPEPAKVQIQNAFTNSEAIFSGEVVEIKESPTDKNSLQVKFKVAKSWKGTSNREMTITTAKESAMCGYSFEVGKKYLVYATGLKEALWVNNCSRTTIDGNKGDAKYLSKLKRKKTIAD